MTRKHSKHPRPSSNLEPRTSNLERLSPSELRTSNREHSVGMPRILIVTGEASGDLHAANLALAIKSLDPDAHMVGVGGARMRAAGVELVDGIPAIDIIGLVGPRGARAVIERVLKVRRLLETERFDVVVLIDNPGLNFHFARIAKKAGHRVVYYITPQVWAW